MTDKQNELIICIKESQKVRDTLHNFAINYESRSFESRKECIDKVLASIKAAGAIIDPEWEKDFDDFYWERGKYEFRKRGPKAYKEFICRLIGEEQ